MDVVEVEAHPPERGGQSLILASGCCTTCCCCSCCLHSVGAVAGAAVGMSLALDALSRAPSTSSDGGEHPDDAATKAPPLAPGAVVIGFWSTAAVVTAAVLGLASSDLEVTGLALAVLYPLLLALVLLLVLPLALLAGPRGMAVWAKLAVGVIVGTVAGGAVMVVAAPALVMFL